MEASGTNFYHIEEGFLIVNNLCASMLWHKVDLYDN